MPKIIVFILLTVCLKISSVGAQDIKQPMHSVGVNSLFLLRNLVGRTNPTINQPILFQYKKWNSAGTSSWRLGVGMNNLLKYKKDPINNSSDFNSDLLLRLGKEWSKPITNKTYFIYGVDVLLSMQYRQSRRSLGVETKTTELTYGPGIAPFLGLRWEFSKRLHLQTEFSLLGFSQFSSIKTNYADPLIPDFDSGLAVDISVGSDLPGILMIQYLF